MYKIPRSDLKECEKPVCQPREKIGIEGDCILCNEFEKVDSEGTGCIIPICGGNDVIEFLSRDGECEPCEPYTYLGDDLRSCLVPICGINERI